MPNVTNIEKICLIDKNNLSNEFYFPSLLEAACASGALSNADAQTIRLGCLRLLETITDRYTKGNSSSVPINMAEGLMKSNFYTIGIQLKSCKTPNDAADALKKSTPEELYTQGRKLLSIKLKATHQFYGVVLSGMLDTDNETYNSTLTGGIKGFFKLYNPNYGAHETHITADYPVCNPISDLAGIEFIQKYLQSFKHENDFCNLFTADAIHDLLLRYNDKYKVLIFNIFEVVLINAIGCVLTKTAPRALQIPSLAPLQAIFANKTAAEITEILAAACQTLFIQLGLKSASLQEYVTAALPQISASIAAAAQISALKTLFIPPSNTPILPQIHFSYGDKMDDETYRKVISDVMECDLISTKIDIIRQEIHSLADLEDLLFDAELDKDELAAIFATLDPTEVAAIAAHHPNEVYELNEEETEFRRCLHAYIKTLAQEVQNFINAAASSSAE